MNYEELEANETDVAIIIQLFYSVSRIPISPFRFILGAGNQYLQTIIMQQYR